MRKTRIGSILAISMVLATLVLVNSAAPPRAEAQAGCSPAMGAATEVALTNAIACYNAGSTTTINMNSDIALTQALPEIDNAAGTLRFNGRGHTLDGDDNNPATNRFDDLLALRSGDLVLSDLTLARPLLTSLVVFAGNADVTGSTFEGGSWGLFLLGGDASTATVENSTFFGQTQASIRTGPAGAANNHMVLKNSTIVNTGFYGIDGGTGTSAATIEGSLIWSSGPSCNVALVRPVVRVGNVFGDNSCSGDGTHTVDMTITVESTLAPNGCTAPCTDTIALKAGSPAIDRNTACVGGVDQRGMARTAAKCDSGAFELTDLGGGGATCNGLVVTNDMNTGGSGIGTAGNDVILGTPGADTIDGGGGNDTICGGFGNDTIDGGAGNDTIFGQQGNDSVNAGAGDDKVFGQGGNDVLLGGAGNDAMRGGVGADRLVGSIGNDALFGNTGNDTAIGGAGNDRLRGQANSDTLNGDGGNDLIIGGGGTDTHNGGAGQDRCFYPVDQGLPEIFTSCETGP